MSRRIVALSSLACVAGCFVSLPVPPSAQVTCATTADCPDGTVCKQSLAMCVSTQGDDGAAPTITAVTLTPDVATIGGTLTLTLTTDEKLGRPPVATLGSAGGFLVTASDDSTFTYTLTYEIRGTEAPGDEAVNVDLVDVFGNEAQLVAATADLDFIAPRLTNAVWMLPGAKRAVKPGDTVTLLANVDIDTTLSGATLFVDSTSVADVSTAFTTSLADTGAGLQLRGDIAIPTTGLHDDSLVSVGFALSDTAGNVTNPQAALSPALPVDSTPPQGTLSLPATSATPSVTATVTTDNAISVTFQGGIDSPIGPQAPVPTQLTLLLHTGNGIHSVTAVFEDDAGNQTTTPVATCDLEVPPGPGSPGLPCNVGADCNSTTCACADAMCSARHCATSSSCGPCHYADNTGACVGTLNNQTPDPIGCSGANTCATGGVCETAVGQTCTLASQCVTGHCSCANPACSTKFCTVSDCGPCHYGLDCVAADKVQNDTPCGSGVVCRVGNCVVRNPGTGCTAVCTGTFTCGGCEVTDDSGCNSAQGFSGQCNGSCPTTGPCQPGSPSCGCF